MINSFIAFRHNNNPLQPLLKVEPNFENLVRIDLDQEDIHGFTISFYLCSKVDNSNKGPVLKIGYKDFFGDRNKTNVLIHSSIIDENNFSVNFSFDNGRSYSELSTFKIEATKMVAEESLPYGFFTSKKTGENELTQKKSDIPENNNSIDTVEEKKLTEDSFTLPNASELMNEESEVEQTEIKDNENNSSSLRRIEIIDSNNNYSYTYEDSASEDESFELPSTSEISDEVSSEDTTDTQNSEQSEFEEANTEYELDESETGEENPEESFEDSEEEETNDDDEVEVADDYYELAEKAEKVHTPLGLKLIAIVSLIVILALGSITALVSYFVTGDVRISAEENNLTINSRTASDAEMRFSTIYNNTNMMLDMLESSGGEGATADQAIASFFIHNETVAAVYIPGVRNIENSKFFLTNGINSEMTDNMFASEEKAITNAASGITTTINVSPYYSIPLTAIVFPYGNANSLVILFSAESLAESFGSSLINSSYMVNNDGYILIHPDVDLMLANADFSSSPIIESLKLDSSENRQLLYTDSDGTEYFGAYRKIPSLGIAIVTQIETQVVFESIRATTRRNIYLTIAVLSLSILIYYGFAKSITTPIKALAAAARQIALGEFKINITPHTRDEIGFLTGSFASMSNALDTFGRFTNKQIAVKAMRGEITLGGETKQATVFFSDIRSFTAISEKLSAEEVVFFLNDYMTRMVACVEKTGGTVDKFIGDAVMAHWGTANTSGSIKEDALLCVRTALMMRHSLIEFNKGRGGDKKPIIRIGCGINTGPVVAGQIGSTERMEYTCIGDTVNFASRTESLNKPLGTDILITENTYELVKDEVLVEPMPSVTVKGKEKPVRMFAVINMPGEDEIPGAGANGPKSLQEIREMLGIPTPDLGGVNLDEEEKKYKIQGK